jgi:hypothetical protein
MVVPFKISDLDYSLGGFGVQLLGIHGSGLTSVVIALNYIYDSFD